jgi:hypothetical protein
MRKRTNSDIFFKRLNVHTSDIPKMRTINEIEIPQLDMRYSLEGNKDLCLVYTLWADESYLKSLYISLITQYKFTDIRKFDIKIFVHHYMHAYACKILSTIIDTEKIISVADTGYMRYSLLKEQLTEYETVIFCDTDAYILGSPKNELYTKLKALSDRKQKTLLCNAPISNIEETLETRRTGKICDIVSNTQEFTELLSRIASVSGEKLDIATRGIGKWPLGGFHVIGDHLFNENDADYNILSKTFKALEFHCDETFWKLWASKYDYRIGDSDIAMLITWKFDIEDKEYFFDQKKWQNDGTNYFFHPFIGKDCYYPQLIQFFEWLITT